MSFADERRRRLLHERVLRPIVLRLEGQRRARLKAKCQTAYDEEGCGAVIGFLRWERDRDQP